MNKIQTLIAQHCPNGVEYKKLQEVCEFKNGFAFKSNLFANDGLPIIRITNIDNNNINLEEVKYFHPSDYKDNLTSYEVNKGDILIAMSGATTGKIGFYDYDNVAYINQRVGKFLPKKQIIDNRYLYHYLLSRVRDIYAIADGGAQPNLSSNTLMTSIKIPIPPIPVQEEIVRILDAFTNLQTNLQTELELRKKQYKYYRDKLLATKKDWKECKLIEVAMYSKTRIFAKELDKNNYVGVDNLLQNCSGKTESNYVPQSGTFTCYQVGDILIGNIRPYLKKIWYANNQGGTNGDVLTIRILEDKTNEVFSKFLYYVLSTDDFFSYNTKHSRGGKMPRGDKDKIINYQIPIPPLEEQKRIVGILDKFDGLVSDIAQGIPAEIEMRKKQYEYYRDSLLRFEEV